MVKKYYILANSNDKTFDIPRQLVEINGEKLIQRTIRLLKQNGIKDITIIAKDKRFDGLGAKRYTPFNNDYDYETQKGYWLNAFPIEIINEPICFIWGDVYFSEQAIKTIVETDTNSTLFFCSYNNNSIDYIKQHDEPLAYKVVDIDLFMQHIDIVKKLYDEGKTVRHPIVWELYRSINNQDVNEHIMTTNYLAINDISCDIDGQNDLIKLKKVIGGVEMIKCEVIQEFTLERFNELKDIQRAKIDTKGKLYVGDTFRCEKELADYLMGNNEKGKVVVKVIEVEPNKKEVAKKEVEDTFDELSKVIGKEIKVEEIKEKKSKKKKKK